MVNVSLQHPANILGTFSKKKNLKKKINKNNNNNN